MTDNGLAPAPLEGGGSQPVGTQPAREFAVAGAVQAADRPEVPVAAAFAGGFVLAMVLKRLAR